MFDILLTLVKEFDLLKIDCSIYLFGSYLNSENWADLDFLVIYKHYDDIHNIKEIFFNKMFDIPLDITFMSEEEERFFNFIIETNAQQIFPSSSNFFKHIT